MLITEIKNDLLTARKNKDQVTLTILTTLVSEAVNVGKTKRNGDSTDEEVVLILKKFKEGVLELQKYRTLTETEEKELEIYNKYLPNSLTDEELSDIISTEVKKIGEISPKMIGSILKFLKDNYFGRFDGKKASEMIKNVLTS